MATSRTSLGELAFQAERGDAEAQYCLGVLFLLGDSVEQNPEAAYKWLAKAAAAQSSEAQSLVDRLTPFGASSRPKTGWPQNVKRVWNKLAAMLISIVEVGIRRLVDLRQAAIVRG